MSRIALAVDGGNSKTHVALVDEDGAVLSLVRGPTCSPEHLGVAGALEVLDGLLAEAGLAPPADVACLLLAGVDFDAEERDLRAGAEARGWARRVAVANDTFAVLRAGTEKGWGVAVVCGAGMNCVGVGPDGRHVRFPALGPITGDWGGGYDVGLAGQTAAARAEDGRGPATTLTRAIPAHFGLSSAHAVAEAIHRGRIRRSELAELAPVVFAEAAHDEVAAGIVDRLRAEIVALARVAIDRLGLDGDVEVLLGGGLLQAGNGRLNGAIAEALPDAAVHTSASPPIVGAALMALDELGAGAEAMARVRTELEDAVRTTTHG
jgi:N-acetylglucosamine kinase-like BadF-type ATPase